MEENKTYVDISLHQIYMLEKDVYVENLFYQTGKRKTNGWVNSVPRWLRAKHTGPNNELSNPTPFNRQPNTLYTATRLARLMNWRLELRFSRSFFFSFSPTTAAAAESFFFSFFQCTAKATFKKDEAAPSVEYCIVLMPCAALARVLDFFAAFSNFSASRIEQREAETREDEVRSWIKRRANLTREQQGRHTGTQRQRGRKWGQGLCEVPSLTWKRERRGTRQRAPRSHGLYAWRRV